MIQRRPASFAFGKIFLAIISVITVALAGVVGTLVALGTPLEKLAFWRPTNPPVISLPVNFVALKAYQAVRRDDLVDPRTGQPATIKIPLASVTGMRAELIQPPGGTTVASAERRVERAEMTEAGVVLYLDNGTMASIKDLSTLGGAYLHATDIIGRVLRVDKSANFAFTEVNFFEKGTPTGLAGATPPGMRAMTIAASQLSGVHRVSAGDRIDLVANIPLDRLRRFELATGHRLPGAELVVDPNAARRSKEERETCARLVARQSIVLTPVTQRVATESTSSLTQGKRVLAIPVEEVVLAVVAEDVAAVTAALELDATVNVLVRSGRRGAAESDVRPVPDGTVAIPIPGQQLLAYQSIQPSAFEEPATGHVRYAYLPKTAVQSAGWITELSQLVGRVLKHDLPAGQPLHENDLMPSGTPPGLSAAVPAGRVLFFLDAQATDGATALTFGQHIDLVASRTEETVRGSSSQAMFANTTLTQSQRTRVESIATDIVVMMPVRSPGNPTLPETNREPANNKSDNSLGQLIVAVRPEQVARLEYTIATKAHLRATVRPNETTRPVSSSDNATSPAASSNGSATRQQTGSTQDSSGAEMQFDPLAGAHTTEFFVGGRKQRMLFIPQ